MLWLNLALGGNAGGSTTNLPDSTVYLVDYIRVYQMNNTHVSTNLIENLTGCSIYPNPAFEQLTVNFSMNAKQKYVIMSVRGRLIKKGTVSSGEIINVSDIKPGVYFFKISSSNTVHKLIIG
jgi:hypothetical protein